MKTTTNATKGLVIARIAAVSVLVICFGIMAYRWISGNDLPDAAVRFLGIVDLIAIPVAAFATIRLCIRSGKNEG